jgi:choline dehydrogenase-like flavoprotein
MPVLGRFDHTIDALKGTQASVFVDDALMTDGYALESMSAAPAYAALMSPGPAMHTFEFVKEFRNLAGFGVMLVDTPSPQNRITLDPAGEPQIEYALTPEDKERFRRGLRKAIEVMFWAGAKEVYLPTTEEVLGTKQDDKTELSPAVLHDGQEADALCKSIQFIPNRTIVTSAHMQATDKMGPSPRDSVVSRSFQVWGADHLYVVDGSIFPTSIGANPMQTIYTFSKIFADRIQTGN